MSRKYYLLTTVLSIVALCACGKKSPEYPRVGTTKDSLAKDITIRDSAAILKDSLTGANDTASSAKDSAALARDSVRIADSLIAHPMTYEQRQGKYVYGKYCSVCHGEEGKADGFNTYNLDPKPHDLTEQNYLKQFSDELLIQIIRDGGRGANKSPSMPPYGWTLSKNEISYVEAFVRTFSPADTSKPPSHR